jgi:hypothetical protein
MGAKMSLEKKYKKLKTAFADLQSENAALKAALAARRPEKPTAAIAVKTATSRLGTKKKTGAPARKKGAI